MLGLLVGVPGLLVTAHGIAPPADVHVDVRRHVMDVTHCDLAAEVIRAPLGELRLFGSLDEVDVEVARAGVTNVTIQR